MNRALMSTVSTPLSLPQWPRTAVRLFSLEGPSAAETRSLVAQLVASSGHG